MLILSVKVKRFMSSYIWRLKKIKSHLPSKDNWKHWSNSVKWFLFLLNHKEKRSSKRLISMIRKRFIHVCLKGKTLQKLRKFIKNLKGVYLIKVSMNSTNHWRDLAGELLQQFTWFNTSSQRFEEQRRFFLIRDKKSSSRGNKHWKMK